MNVIATAVIFPVKNPFRDPSARTPLSVKIYGPPDSAINLPTALKNDS
jgi:hypothetical protein